MRRETINPTPASSDVSPEPFSEEVNPQGETNAREAISVKSFLSDTVIFGLVGVFDRAIGFLLLPVTTAYMTTSQYGLLALFTTTTEIMQYLVALGIFTSFFKHYTEETGEQTKKEIINAAFWQVTLLALLFSLLFIPFAGLWDAWLFETGGLFFALMTVPSTYFAVLISLGDSRLQADGRALTYMTVNMFQTATTRGLALLLLILNFGATGWVIGQSIGQVVSISLLAVLAFRGVSIRPNRVWLGRLFWYGLPLVPLAVSHWSMQGSARYFMNALLEDPKHYIGLYTFGERISQIMAMLNLAFALGWRRFAFSNIHHPDGSRLLGVGASLFFVISSFGALGLIALGDDLTRWVIRPEFWGGIVVIPYLTMAAFFWGMTEVVAISLYKSSKTYLLSAAFIVAAVLCVVLNYFLIQSHGMLGAAEGWLYAEVIKFLLVFVLGQREFRLSIQYGRILHALAVFVPTLLACMMFFPTTTAATTFAQIGLVALAPVLLLVTGFLQPHERANLQSLINRLLAR